MSIKLKKRKLDLVHPVYAAAKRQPPKFRFFLILALISLPLLFLIYTMLSYYVFVQFPGYVAFDRLDVRAPIAGYVKKLPVHLGDYIKAGQTLVEFESPMVNTRLSYLENDKKYLSTVLSQLRNKNIAYLEQSVVLAEKDVELTLEVYQRFKKYREKGVIQEMELEQARRNWVDAKRKLTELQNTIAKGKQEFSHRLELDYKQRLRDINNQISQLKQQQALLTLKASQSGHIYQIYTYSSEFVGQGQKLLSLITEENMHIVAFVEPRFINEVYQGKEVKITFPDKKVMPGVIHNIPSYSEQSPATESSPIAKRGNKILVIIRLKEPLANKYHVYGVPVKVDL